MALISWTSVGLVEPVLKIAVVVKVFRVTDQQGKDKTYWIVEIAFLEARLNGSQGDIDSEDRAGCEEALKAAKANLAASR